MPEAYAVTCEGKALIIHSLLTAVPLLHSPFLQQATCIESHSPESSLSMEDKQDCTGEGPFRLPAPLVR